MFLIETIKDDWSCRLPDKLKYNQYCGFSRLCYQILCLLYYPVKTVFLLLLSAYYYFFYGLYLLLKFFFDKDVYYDDEICDEDDEELDYDELYSFDKKDLVIEIEKLRRQVEILNRNMENERSIYTKRK